MAQPIASNIPPVKICAFGSNNKFTADDVQNRAATISEKLSEEGHHHADLRSRW